MKYIGIEGISYVGSTLLSLILGSHPDCLSVGHLYTFFHKPKECEICKLLDKKCPLKFNKGNVKKQLEKFNKTIIDSSTVSWWFNKIKPDHTIWMFRDPVSLASSYVKSGKKINYMIEAYIRKYKKAEMTIEYKNILEASPELKRLFDKLGLEFKEDYLKYWNYENHMVGGNQGVLIEIARHKRPEKLEEMINRAAKNNKKYKEYYKNKFDGNIDILTSKQKDYVMSKCGKTYEKLKRNEL